MPSLDPDVRRILLARALRGFTDGWVSVLLAIYLAGLGFTPMQIGVIATGTLLGSAALTVVVGLLGHRWRRRSILLFASALMFGTGLGFLEFRAFWPIFLVSVIGTLNPSAGDVSIFLPAEQAALSEVAVGKERTAAFAWYNLGGSLMGALGALASAVPGLVARFTSAEATAADRWVFFVYAATAIAVGLTDWGLSPAVEHRGPLAVAPLAKSRRTVLRLAALFSLDSFGGGLVVQSLLVLWLYRRFQLSTEVAGAVFFAAGVASAFSQLASSRLANRIGLIRTMVYTHLPSNAFLILAGIMPNAPLAIACLLLRYALSQMDVPARQSYVMAIVPPEERAAASSITNVPRSLAAAISPLLTGAMLSRSDLGWPLICAGSLKAVYDLLLLRQFKDLRPPHESPIDPATANPGAGATVGAPPSPSTFVRE